MSNNITIKIAYESEPTRVVLEDLLIPQGTMLSELNEFLPVNVRERYEGQDDYYGIFGERPKSNYVLSEGDRVELYRSLIFDPMESRRRRAEHKRQKALKEKK